MMRCKGIYAILLVASSVSAGDVNAQVIKFAHTRIGPWDVTCYSTYISPEAEPKAPTNLLTDVRCQSKSGPLSFSLVLMDREKTFIGLNIEENRHRIYDAIAFDDRLYPIARMNDAREAFSKLRFTDVETPSDAPCRFRYQPNCRGAHDSGISGFYIERAPGFWLGIQRFIAVLFDTKTLSLRYKQLPADSDVGRSNAGAPVTGPWEHRWESFDVEGLDRVAEWCEKEMRSRRSRLFHNDPREEPRDDRANTPTLRSPDVEPASSERE